MVDCLARRNSRRPSGTPDAGFDAHYSLVVDRCQPDKPSSATRSRNNPPLGHSPCHLRHRDSIANASTSGSRGLNESLSQTNFESNASQAASKGVLAISRFRRIADTEGDTMNPVVHFEMPFDNRERMAKFYRSAFGWQTQMLDEEMDNYVLATTT